ncbi:Coiled-coil domain-containing protein 73 [Acipenser ruthenus]|uniref:Coiled-coil domain-containing protein 73 n=1 Tax=Acipenser ruthenus TaxID=7906 RepID=A0A444U0Y9_ACIRT|nr:Coiled-coil domain-containing protein 73 [Acipenser ruthenus]
MNKRLDKEYSIIRTEKQEVLNSLQHAQQLLQRQTEVVSKVEAELNALQEKYQVLERDNTLLREKTKEKEDRFLHLTEEHDKSKTNWEKESALKTEHCKAGEDLNKENSRISIAIVNKCTDVSLTEPEKTVNDELPKTDYCVVINVQTADVYAFGSKDTEGAENTCSKADIASPTRKPQGSPDTLAEVPVKGKMLSDSVDALGVSGADIDSPTIKRVPDMLNTSSTGVHLCHKRDPREEWKAVAQAFCEFSSTEHESPHFAKLQIPYTSVPSQAVSSSKTDSVADHLHDPVLIAHNKHETSISASGFENSSPETDEWDYQQISINDQVSKIEKFLSLEKLRRTRKRKVDGSINELEKNAISEL